MHTSNTEQNTEMTDQSLRESIREVLKGEFYVNEHENCSKDCSKRFYADEAWNRGVDAIIACFKDEGWRHNYAAGYWSKEAEREGLMTGAEFYQRFEIEYNKFTESYNPSGDGFYEKKWGIEAAKRASNLTPETRKERRKRMSDHWEDL